MASLAHFQVWNVSVALVDWGMGNAQSCFLWEWPLQQLRQIPGELRVPILLKVNTIFFLSSKVQEQIWKFPLLLLIYIRKINPATRS